MLNIISELNQNTTVNGLYTHNGVCAWFLEKAFKKQGVKVNRVNVSSPIPPSEITVITVRGLLTQIRKSKEYREKLRQSTKIVSSYFVANLVESRGIDISFTQIDQGDRSVVHVGWGADPEHCYPEEKDCGAFIDSYLPHRKFSKTLQKTYHRILGELGLTSFQPILHHGDTRIPWPKYQRLLRRSRFFLQTHFGDYGGLNMWEASRCGVMNVSPYPVYAPITFEGLDHRVWQNEGELLNILSEETNPLKISRRASVNTWERVVKGMLKEFDKY